AVAQSAGRRAERGPSRRAQARRAACVAAQAGDSGLRGVVPVERSPYAGRVNRSVFPHVGFPDYALLDSGGGEKLERFADVVVRRPDPQALWERGGAESAWSGADLTFVPDASSGGRGGTWRPSRKAQGDAPSEWSVRCGEAT